MVQWNRSLPWRVVIPSLSILALVAVAVPLLAQWSGKAQRDAISQLGALRAVVDLDDDQNVRLLRIPPGGSLKALEHMAALPRLKMLVLPLTDAGDDDLAHLRGSAALEELILSGNHRITDEGLKHLRGLPNLKALYLTDVPINGSGLKYLSGLEHLELLNLAFTQITDANLVNASGLKARKFLDMIGTQISDAGLDHLRGLKKLERLVVTGARVTPAGAEKLKQSLPHVDVKFGR